MPVSDKDKDTWIVVTREPDTNPDSLITRGTRTFPVYKLDSGEVCFLKDGWRTDLEDMMNEITILRQLKEAEVCGIPNFLGGR